jgi:hypothetical protein
MYNLYEQKLKILDSADRVLLFSLQTDQLKTTIEFHFDAHGNLIAEGAKALTQA